MAREEIQGIYCWEIRWDSLNIYLASTRKGARRVGLTLGGGGDCLAYFGSAYPGVNLLRDETMNAPLIEAIESTMMNRRSPKDLCLDIRGTLFQWKVWEAMKEIPFGRTLTYGEMAEIVGRPGAARAVGQAAGRNPLPLVFP